MSERGIGSADDDQSLTESRLARVIAACDEFEVAWRDGLKPRIEDYRNSQADPLLRSSLLYELLSGGARASLPVRRNSWCCRTTWSDSPMTPRWCAACSRRRGSSDRSNQSGGWETTADEPRDTTLTVVSGEHDGTDPGVGPASGSR